MTKTKFNLKKSQEIAEKMEQIWSIIFTFTDEDMKYLNKVSKDIGDETSKLEAVQGILVDFDKAKAKMKLGQQARNRIKGIIMIRNAIDNTHKANKEYLANQHNKKTLDSFFGL